VLGIYGISHDITELRRAQDSLEQTRTALFRTQKMEAVGQLTGGIAHDFNNILMVILGILELLKLRLPDGDGLDLVSWIQAQGLRTPVAVVTAHGNVETAGRALK